MERTNYYDIPDQFKVQRVNLREKPGQAIRLEQPSGQLAITFFGKDRKFPYAVTSTPQEKTLVLIASGQGKVIKEGQEFNLDGTPAVFFLNGADRIETLGDFSGWIVHLKETQPTPNLPTTQTDIDQWTPQESELVKIVENENFPNTSGRIVKWCMGQWNSKSPIDIAYEGGGVGSIGNGLYDLEEQVSEIHLAMQGRIIFTSAANPTLDGGGNIMTDKFKMPIRTGDVIIAKPGSVITMSRYSGDYKGFCLKWAVNPGEIIDPRRKKEIKL